MNLQSRLMIAFIIVLLVPLGLVYVTFNVLSGYQMKLMQQTYNVEAVSGEILSEPGNTMEYFDAFNKKSFEIVEEALDKEPEMMQGGEGLEALNDSLADWYSFIIVRNGRDFSYIGTEEEWSDQLEDQLPAPGTYTSEQMKNLVIYAGSTNCLLKMKDYWNSGAGAASGSYIPAARPAGTVYVITPIRTLPQLRNLYVELMVSTVFIMLITALLMFLWVYGAVISPIQKLRKATREIRDGNLDYQLDVVGDDEISVLCQDFEDMRVRLKRNAEEKVRDEEMNREMISNISHDLKTPITSIKGYVEGIMDGVASSPDRLDRYIRTIYNKANDMDRLVDELTIYSKIDTNNIPYNFSPIGVVDYFGDCSEELQLELEGQGIRMQYTNLCSPDVRIIADPEQLKRVINNIVSNSVKYMDKKHGIISMRVKDLGDMVQVDIEDNGKGIAVRDLPYIFDRFYRTDKARSSKKGGSGIGLAIARKIIEDHGGMIWAASREGIGTIMYFSLRKYQEVQN
ncbi:MAG: sensor histidine kinase [Lachnospiraceae bacterium]